MSLPATDNFNRADAGSLGANWTNTIQSPSIVSNACAFAASGDLAAFWNVDTFPNDQYSQGVPSAGTYAGVMVRGTTTGGGTGYIALLDSAGTVFLQKYTAGARNSLTSAAVTYSAGAVLRLEVVGTNLTVKYNGSAVITNYSDASHASGSAGVGGIGPSTTLDDWEGGSLATDRPQSHAWPNPVLAPRPTDRLGFTSGLNLPIYFYVPPPPFFQTHWPNPVRRVNAPAWQQSVTQGLSIPRDADYFYGLVYVSVAGVARAQGRLDTNARIKQGSLTITDVLADTPNTCAFIAEGFTPIVGQEVVITLGSATMPNPERIFAGTILNVQQLYDGAPINQSFQVNCIDWTWQLNKRKVIKRYTSESATAIATDLIATYAPGFTAGHVAGALDVIDEITFTNQSLTSALAQLAKRIGASWYVDYRKSLHFFLEETDSNPVPLTAAHPSLTSFSARTDISQWVTRAFSEGGGGDAASAVAVGETILPVTDASWYEELGGLVACGSQRLTYTGRSLGGGGGLVGPGASPTTTPVLALAAGAGVESGSHDYAVTFVTAAGESIASPVGTIAVGTVAAPSSAPTAGAPTAGSGVTTGEHTYGVTFVTAAGETTVSPLSGSVTTGPVTGTEVTAPGVAPTAGTPTIGSGVDDGSHDYVVTYANAAGETTVSPISGTAVAGQVQTGTLSAPGSAPTASTITYGGSVDPGAHDYAVTFTSAAGETTASPLLSQTPYGINVPAINTANATPTTGGSMAEGGYIYRMEYWDGSGRYTQGTATSLSVTVTSGNTAIAFTSLPVSGDSNITNRKLYRTVVGSGGNAKLVTTLDNVATTYTDTLADGGLGADANTTTTAIYGTVPLTGIPTGAAGTTSRKIYRTVAAGSQLKLLATIANNTATTYTDTTADASLGANVPTSNTAHLYTAYNVVPLTGIPTSAQSITGRKLYRRFNGSGTFKLVTTISGNVTTTYSDTKLNSALGADAPTSNTTAGTTDYNVVPLTAIPLGSAIVTSRRIYRTAAGGSQLKLVATIADNTTTTYSDSTADGSLGANVPTSNTAVANRVSVSSIQLGGATVTSRKLYRTVAAGVQLKLLATIADNTTTTYADSTADASLGANVPTSDASGLTQPNGQVAAGSTLLIVAGTGAFAAGGGWAVIGNGQQVIRYTGVTSTALTGIPASGAGAIVASVGYNSTVTAAPQLTGIPGSGVGSMLYAIAKGDQVNLLVQADDPSGQAALSLLLDPLNLLGGAAGIQEDYRQDGRIGYAEAASRAAARLAVEGGVVAGINYVVRDPLTKSGRTVSVTLPAPQSIADDFLIQRVVISAFSASAALFPTYTVEASSSAVSFEQLLASLQGGAP